VLYRSKLNPFLGRNFEALDPLEWLARMSDHIPDVAFVTDAFAMPHPRPPRPQHARGGQAAAPARGPAPDGRYVAYDFERPPGVESSLWDEDDAALVEGSRSTLTRRRLGSNLPSGMDSESSIPSAK
jgi:hypothetical protein